MSYSSTPEEIELLTRTIDRILEAMSIHDTITVLFQTDFLLKSLDEDYKKNNSLNQLQKSIEHFTQNEQNMRILRLQQKISNDLELSMEYLDNPRGNDERLFYNKDLETDIQKIYEKIRISLGVIVKTKISGGDISF